MSKRLDMHIEVENRMDEALKRVDADINADLLRLASAPSAPNAPRVFKRVMTDQMRVKEKVG